MKVCSKCVTRKPNDAFHRRTASPDGLQAYCKACFHDYYMENQDHLLELSRQYHKEHGYSAPAPKPVAIPALVFAGPTVSLIVTSRRVDAPQMQGVAA